MPPVEEVVVSAPTEQPSTEASKLDIAERAWSMIEQSENPEIFRAFIEKFPDTPQRQLAELKLLLLPSAPVESKDNALPNGDASGTVNLYSSNPSQTQLSDTGSNSRYSWTAETVEDKEKELIWQRQEVEKKNFVGAQLHCEGLQLAGASDWRLPLMSELRELNRQITSDSEVYKEIFSQPMDNSFWSGALTDMGTRVWAINLWTGRAGTIDPKQGDQRQFLCVRDAGASAGATEFTKSGTVNLYESKTDELEFFLGSGSNGRYYWTPETVEDKEKELIWQRQEVEKKNFVGAQLHCEGLQLAGASDWRLPLMSELRELNRQIKSGSEIYKEIFNQPMDNFFWSGALTDMGTRVWTLNLWTGRAGTIDPKQGDQLTTMCVRNTQLGQTTNNSERTIDLVAYERIQKASIEVVGCGFFHVGCLEEPLKFPSYQANFHLKGYRRVHLWGKDRPWTQTGLLVNKGDLVYFYGTGEVTTCPHSNCNQRGPQQLDQGTISYQIGNNQPQTLSRFTKIHFNGGGFQNSDLASTSGFLTLTIRDGDLSTSSYKNYEDNSGVYILDIFVIDPKQEEGFKRFKDSLFGANPEDSNVKAYLSR